MRERLVSKDARSFSGESILSGGAKGAGAHAESVGVIFEKAKVRGEVRREERERADIKKFLSDHGYGGDLAIHSVWNNVKNGMKGFFSEISHMYSEDIATIEAEIVAVEAIWKDALYPQFPAPDDMDERIQRVRAALEKKKAELGV